MAKQEAGEFYRNGDISSSISKCIKLFDSGIISPEHMNSPLFEAAVIQLLINMSDLLAKARVDGKRVNFTDDVVGELDVTELVRRCRNAACHISTGEHMIEDLGKFTFNVVAGKMPQAMEMNGVCYGSDYEDDIAVYYGDKRVYLRRHLLRALDSVIKIYGYRNGQIA